MASSTNALSYLDPSAYQNIVPSSTTSASAPTAAASGSGPAAGVSATDEIKAMESQGDFQAYLSSSVALALLQTGSSNSSATDSATLISNMLQQVMGAYQTQTTPATGSSTAASGVSALG